MPMNDGTPPRGPDRGDPVAELRELLTEPSADFTSRLVRRIDRRETSNHALWLIWTLPCAFLISLIDLAFGLFSPAQGDDGGPK